MFCEQNARVFRVSEYKHCALKSYALLFSKPVMIIGLLLVAL